MPPMVIVIGTALPGCTVEGTATLIWYNPTNPGVKPENDTPLVAFTVPMVTVGVEVVVAKFGPGGAALPGPGSFVTGPSPVA